MYLEKLKKVMFIKDYSAQLNTALTEYENRRPYKQYSIDWICDRIDWCWKWKKITEKEKDSFCERIVKVMEGDY